MWTGSLLVTKSQIVRKNRPPSPNPSTARNLFVLVLLAALLVAVLLLTRSKNSDPDGSSGPVNTPASPGIAYAVNIPRVAEIAHSDLIYTLISASVTPNTNNSAVRLRIRVSNEGRYDANFWDDSFRLVVNGGMLAPTSGLNKLVPGHSIDQGIVTFEAPRGASKVSLRIEYQGQTGEVPLDLSPSAGPAEDEKKDPGNVLSSAILTKVMNEPKVLLNEQYLRCNLITVTTRRFANKLRAMIGLRVGNSSTVPEHSSVLLLRLRVDNQLLAPVREPNEVLQPNTEQSVDYVFDFPPSVTHTVLQARVRNSMAEIPLDLR
jgi:hypothetical protein